MIQPFETILVRQGALTLAGMKPGSLFCLTSPDLTAIRQQVSHWNLQLCPLGLSITVLLERESSGSALVYLFRPSQLARLLSLQGQRRFLERFGYEWGDLSHLLSQLSLRLRLQKDFPHEIGIFLGYPLRDVVGFIQHGGKDFTCCGLWKSYGKREAMEKCFACYRQCIDRCVKLYEQGIPLEHLAVTA